jgi:hypothetical protein
MYPVPEHDAPPLDAPGERPSAPVAPFGTAPVPPPAPLGEPFSATRPAAAPLDPLGSVTWSRGLDDLLPVTPRPQARTSLSVRDVFRRRRPQVEEPEPRHPLEPADDADPGAVAPVPGVTPDDRASYAFWSRDAAPLADFSDMAALPDEPLDGGDAADR